MQACAAPRANTNPDEAGTWITDAMLDVYCQLHDRGVAHSFECWSENNLVGGIYGLVLGDIFFGESMFSKVKDASKYAMYYLCNTVRPFLIDAQVYSDHLSTLGAEKIDRSVFTSLVQSHLNNSLRL